MSTTELEIRKQQAAIPTHELVDMLNSGALTGMAANVARQVLLERASTSTEYREALVAEMLHYEMPASLPRRLFAELIDSAIAIALLLIGVVASKYVNGAFLSGVMLSVVYILIADAFPNGQSWGKAVLGIKVIDASTKKPCSYGQSLVRNFFRVLGPIDWVFIFGAKRQRLGDKAANTFVIYTSDPNFSFETDA